MKRSSLAVAALMLVWVWSHSHADAPTTKPPIILDALRIEPSPVADRAMVQALVRAVDVTGHARQTLADGGKSAWSIALGQRTLAAPVAISRAGAAQVETAMAIVIATTPDFAEAAPMIAQALGEVVLTTLRRDDRVAVLTYASTVGGGSRLGATAQAQAALGALAADADEADASMPVLVDAVERAVAAVERYRPTHAGALVRRVVIVVSDGVDGALDRERVTALGQRAGRKGVRIFTMAYAPSGHKGPLLNLGELSKQSLGTLRWARTGTEQAFREQLSGLASELLDAHVLTAFIAPPAGAADVRVVANTTGGPLTSNALAWKAPACDITCASLHGACAEGACVAARASVGATQAWLRRALYLGGAALAICLGLVGLWLWRRRQPMREASMPGVTSKQSWECLRGPLAGRIIEVRVGDVIGNQRGCAVRLDDPMVSQRHAEIRHDRDHNIIICDLGSTNGTTVGGVRVTQGKLRVGAIVGFGSSQWRVVAQT